MQAMATPRLSTRADTPQPRAGWLSFLLQIALVAGVEVGDDLLRALISPNDPRTAVANAGRIVDFEAAHGLWIEPGLQRYLEQTHQFLGLPIGWDQIVPLVNGLYSLGQTLFALSFALWVWLRRRPLFAFVRDVFLLTNALALALYEAFPVAPPRLTPGLQFDGRAFVFRDTVFGPGSSGARLSFNEYSAMPSLHVAWALIVAATLAWAARPRLVRLLAPGYPVAMLFTVVVSGNHYLLDGLGAGAVVLVAGPAAMLIRWRLLRDASPLQTLGRLQRLRRVDQAAPAPAPSVPPLVRPGKAA